MKYATIVMKDAFPITETTLEGSYVDFGLGVPIRIAGLHASGYYTSEGEVLTQEEVMGLVKVPPAQASDKEAQELYQRYHSGETDCLRPIEAPRHLGESGGNAYFEQILSNKEGTCYFLYAFIQKSSKVRRECSFKRVMPRVALTVVYD